jgi:hypothetical protein
MRSKRRALVLGDESARHPFLASLPPHVRRVEKAPPPRRGLARFAPGNWREFLAAYCASFVAVSIFIA